MTKKTLAEQLQEMLGEDEGQQASDQSEVQAPVWSSTNEIAEELIKLHSQQRELQDRIAELKTALLDSGLEEGTKVTTADGVLAAVIRRNGARFDEVTAREVLPEALLDMITVRAVDPKVAKAKLPPEMYAKCRKPGKITVVLK